MDKGSEMDIIMKKYDTRIVLMTRVILMSRDK
jgi:hypothetical protein